MRLLNNHTSFLVEFRSENEIIQSAGETVHLKEGCEDSCKGSEKFTSFFRAIDLIEGVDHTEFRGSVLVFI